MQNVTLDDIRPLTNNEYDKAHQEAIKRVQRRTGKKPARQQFERDYGPLWTMPDKIAALVGLSAWLVSSAHILNHAGRLAAVSYSNTVAGLPMAGVMWAQHAYGLVHQVGFIILAEAAMILFMIMHSSNRLNLPEDAPSWRRIAGMVTIPLVLALLTATFVFVANWQSGIGILESLLPPSVTIGLGIYFEGRIAEGLRRREEVTAKYLAAVDDYDAAQDDPESAGDFEVLLRQALAYYLQNKRANKELDVPLNVLQLAVARELERQYWADEDWNTDALRAVLHGDDPGTAQGASDTVSLAAISNGNGHSGGTPYPKL